MMRAGDNPALRKERGAFFTPPEIADFLASWAVAGDPNARILDPTCGEAVFLRAAGLRLKELGCTQDRLDEQLLGTDVHPPSVAWAANVLQSEGLGGRLVTGDFFDIATPDQLGAPFEAVDAVIGNPPYVRYQRHVGLARDKSVRAALRQGVRLSGLASSWAALLVHACGFLKPDGRLAMVLPAELLTVGYAEPIRAWLRNRFEQVHLVVFERLQFPEATENVVLVMASGSGGCDAFSLYYLDDAADLAGIRPMTNLSVVPADNGKWTDLLLPNHQRRLFKEVNERFTTLACYGKPELGTVTGANHYFTMSERTRTTYGLAVGSQVVEVCPPGTRHLRGLTFTRSRWTELRDKGERVWLVYPDPDDDSDVLAAYLEAGRAQRVDRAYKCRVRSPWWRPPVVAAPDLFFTYMSHRHPRLISNTASATFVNSMHGVRLRADAHPRATAALPLVSFNSVTLLGAEIFGRSYGGGILKMEPREAAMLPMPAPSDLDAAWELLQPLRESLGQKVADGGWADVVDVVDSVLLGQVIGLESDQIRRLSEAALSLRSRRMTRHSADQGPTPTSRKWMLGR